MTVVEAPEARQTDRTRTEGSLVDLNSPWRKDPLLSESFDRFEAKLSRFSRFGAFRVRDNALGLYIPEKYVFDVIELANNWGNQDRETRPEGIDNRKEIVWAHDLYRDGRAELVATIVPHVRRYDRMVRVDSLEHAGQVFQIVFDARNRRITELEKRVAVSAVAPSENGLARSDSIVEIHKGSAVKPLATFKVA